MKRYVLGRSGSSNTHTPLIPLLVRVDIPVIHPTPESFGVKHNTAGNSVLQLTPEAVESVIYKETTTEESKEAMVK